MNTSLYRKAVILAKARCNAEARALLEQVLREDPTHEAAWLWYAECVETREARLQALESCVRSNPEAKRAQESLAAMKRAHQVWDTQPIVLRMPAFIAVTGATSEVKPAADAEAKAEPRPTADDPAILQTPTPAAQADERILSEASAVFTVPPDRVPADEIARREVRARLQLQRQANRQPTADPWSELVTTPPPPPQPVFVRVEDIEKTAPLSPDPAIQLAYLALAASILVMLVVSIVTATMIF